MVETLDLFGHLDVNVTLLVVIVQVIEFSNFYLVIWKFAELKWIECFTDLQPPNENGWFWSGSGSKIGPTSARNTGDWSHTGGYGQAQPDNREAAQGNDESCLSILNNFYNDGLKWHDVACHHLKPFVCEDSDELLNFVRSRNPGIRL